jgi:putative ABC transport system substrate-binding protein
MDRRSFLSTVALSLLTAPRAVEAEQAGKVYRLGYLGHGSAPPAQELLAALRLGLREHDLIEGQNIHIEYRWAEGQTERLADLARELVRSRIDILIATVEPAILAAKQATDTIPIVMVGAADPVTTGLVASLARPGGNITGLTLMAPELAGKRLEFLKAAIPNLHNIAVLWNADNPAKAREFRETENAGRLLGLALQPLELRAGRSLERVFATVDHRAQGLLVLGDAIVFFQRTAIVRLADRVQLPIMWEVAEYLSAGGLMSYGPSLTHNFRRAATYVDKILKGTKPADLPVEQPTKFELVINLRTARALGLTIPQSLLVRADQLIE